MSDKQDLDALARQFLDLWEDQVTALASDPKTMETAGRMFALAVPLFSNPFLSIFAQNCAHNTGSEKSETMSETKNDQNKKPEKDNKDEKVQNSSIIETDLAVKKKHDRNPQTDGTLPSPDQAQPDRPPFWPESWSESWSTSWPAPFAPPSGGRNNDLVEFERRIADIEKRLAQLESGAGKPGRRSKNGARKR